MELPISSSRQISKHVINKNIFEHKTNLLVKLKETLLLSTYNTAEGTENVSTNKIPALI